MFFNNCLLTDCFFFRHRSQEEKGQGRPCVHDDAQGRFARNGVQGAGAVGRQGIVGEQNRAHVGHPGGVQETVQRRRPRWLVQNNVRNRQATGADTRASVRRSRSHGHFR